MLLVVLVAQVVRQALDPMELTVELEPLEEPVALQVTIRM